MAAVSWDGVQNVRDLGGLGLPGGVTTRSGVVIRSGSLDGLTALGRAQLLALRPSRIIDLRSDHEVTQASPVNDQEVFRRLPFVDPVRDAERDPSVEQTRFDLYCGSLRRNGRHVARIWTEVADAGQGPVVVYCRSGVDRTGMLVALLLSVAGVDNPTIAEDYALAAGPDADLSATSGSRRDVTRPVWTGKQPDVQTMLKVLDWIGAHYGGADKYLSQHGVSDTHIAIVRQKLGTPPTKPTTPRDSAR